MARHILYAYVVGSDLHDIADDLLAAFERFAATRTWVCNNPQTVNHSHPIDPSLREGDLPDWDLGLNITLPDPGHETPGWFSDVIAVAEFLATLHVESGREFAIGISDTQSGINHDLHYIQSADPGLLRLRAIIGVGAIE